MTRYKITITVTSSCKKGADETDNKLGRWRYMIDHGGLTITGEGQDSNEAWRGKEHAEWTAPA